MTKDEQIAKLLAALKQAGDVVDRQQGKTREFAKCLSNEFFSIPDDLRTKERLESFAYADINSFMKHLIESLSAIDTVLGDIGAVAAVTPVSESNAAIPLDGGQNNTTKDDLVQLARLPAPTGDATSVGLQAAVRPIIKCPIHERYFPQTEDEANEAIGEQQRELTQYLVCTCAKTSTTSQSDECRKAFEEWYFDTYKLKQYHDEGGTYYESMTQTRWLVWLASRAQRDAELVRALEAKKMNTEINQLEDHFWAKTNFNSGLNEAISIINGGTK